MGFHRRGEVQDKWHDSYEGAPTDGSAYEGTGSDRVLRGGSFSLIGAERLRAVYRRIGNPGGSSGGFGFRLARSSR